MTIFFLNTFPFRGQYGAWKSAYLWLIKAVTSYVLLMKKKMKKKKKKKKKRKKKKKKEENMSFIP